MQKIILTLSLIALTGFCAIAQMDWNWPEEGTELWDQSQEKQAYYKVNFQLDEWEKAFGALLWLYENNPDLHPSIYKDGIKIIEEILQKEIPEERAPGLRDSVLWMYDQRIKLFDEGGEVLDRKAYSAFKFYYRDPSKYAMIDTLFDLAYRRNVNDMSIFILTPYMTMAKFYNQVDPEKMPPEKVLEIHDRISQAIEYQSRKGSNTEQLNDEQNKVDAMLSSIGNILSCEFIEKQLVPRFRAQPEDLNTAKKIFTYSLKAKCADQPYFAEAGQVVFANDPSHRLAMALGSKYLNQEEGEKALNYFDRALEMATLPEEKYEAILNQALVYSKLGQKVKARDKSIEALKVKPGDSRTYNIIGNLYFTSFDECKKGESKVLDRAVFIAAYEMYQRAGNEIQMKSAREQFPSIEEIFNEGYEEGEKVTIGCWINEMVKLERRN